MGKQKPLQDTKQATVPPLMMYDRDRTKLEGLDWDAHGLFWAALMWLVDGGNDYAMVVPRAKLALAASRRASLKTLEKAAAELVAEGVWKVHADGWEVVLHHQPPIDVWQDLSERFRWLRHKRLHRDTDLVTRIKERDRLLCRYCGVRTRWDADHRSDISGTLDHVDPDGDNSFDNVVVACKRCNEKLKKRRTPEQAGMSLFKPGTTAEDISAGRARLEGRNAAQANSPERKARSDLGQLTPPGDSDPDRSQIGAGSEIGSARARPRLRTGPDPIRNGAGSVPARLAGGPPASEFEEEPVPPPPWSDEQADLYPVDDEGDAA